MKFRAQMSDITYIMRFHHAVNMLSKFCKQCVIRISVDGLFFIAFTESGEKQPLAWCKMPQQQYFSEFLLVGVSKDFNEICLQFTVQTLLKVLASFKPSHMSHRALKISLTNRKMPCLTFELFKTEGAPVRLCLHDIPVEVIPRKLWGDIAPPEIALDPDLIVTMPESDDIESIWEKLKTYNKHIVVLANGRGCLSIRIDSDLLVITSHYKDLTVETSANYEDPDEFVKCRVKSTQFMLLKDLYHNSVKIHLHIRAKKYLLFHVFFDELTLYFVVPSVKE